MSAESQVRRQSEGAAPIKKLFLFDEPGLGILRVATFVELEMNLRQAFGLIGPRTADGLQHLNFFAGRDEGFVEVGVDGVIIPVLHDDDFALSGDGHHLSNFAFKDGADFLAWGSGYIYALQVNLGTRAGQCMLAKSPGQCTFGFGQGPRQAPFVAGKALVEGTVILFFRDGFGFA